MKENRAKLLFYIFIISISLLFLRAFQLQIINWEKYTIEVQDLGTRITTEVPQRGNIYDRNGKLLAWDEKVYRIDNINGPLSEKTEKELYMILKDVVDNPYSVIDRLNFQKKVTLDINSIVAQKIANIDKNLKVQEKYIRKYAHESLYHILGYVDNEGNARTGLELIYDELLMGKVGFNMINISSNQGKTNTITKSPSIKGNDIYLTLDIDLQIKAYNYLKETNNTGAILLSNPNTGEILAFVSYPSPNPNLFSQGMTTLEFQRILNDRNKPLINKAISASYPPGSIIKPFIAYVALEAGISPDKTIYSTGRYDLKNSDGRIIASYYDWNVLGHGETNLVKSLTASVNSYYYWLGEQLGIEYLVDYADKFDLVDKTGIEIPNEKIGLFPGPQWKAENYGNVWYPGETLLSYIGQAYINMTPAQVLRMYNIFATKGDYYEFHLFKKAQDTFGNVLMEKNPILKDSYKMKEDYLKYIYEGMIKVTTYQGKDSSDQGTAYESFKDFPLTVAGKTGTAEVGGGKLSHSWFAGFLPANTPQYSIVVFVENGGMGSTTAAPIARKVLDDLIESYF